MEIILEAQATQRVSGPSLESYFDIRVGFRNLTLPVFVLLLF